MRRVSTISTYVQAGVCLGLLLVSGCGTKERNTIDKYFDTLGFIDEQITLLNHNQVQLSKTVAFGDKTESILVETPDSTLWQKELRIFREHDINKPVLVDAYQTSEQTRNGEKITAYKLKDSTGSGILDMEIIYDAKGEVSSWSSSFLEENLLYCNFRKVKLTTDTNGMLSSYLVDGFHKLMFKDTVHYQLQVKINDLR